MSCPRNKHNFRCDQNGPSARREEGAYLERYVTDPAGAGQPPAHFHRNPLGRGQLAVFPRCSLLTYRFRYDRRSRLEKQPTDLRRNQRDLGDGTLPSYSNPGYAPPSRTIFCPVRKPAWVLQRNAAKAPNSSGCPKRPAGIAPRARIASCSLE